MTPQSAIAHYRLTSKLGEGGMGAVYRATDTKLNREVAIKILPDALASDPDYLARFTREAQALAALNHPNIAAVYGIEERAIVMELVPGATLQERIDAGPVPLEEALQIAGQIADALEAAHEKGIIHRDLKPANVKLTPDGIVKVLDFGLAKTPESSTAAPANSPTLTMRATQAGVIMGTAGYMAPEQAAGRPVDRRADIWSFGVVLHELLTGKTLFTGETVSHTLASVLKDPIFVDIPQAPPPIRRLLARCLNRSVKDRLRDIGEARIAIREYLANPVVETPASASAPTARRSWRLPALCATLCVALAASLLWHLRPAPPQQVTRFTLATETGVSARNIMALSPDGTSLVYVVARQLYLRSFAEWEAKPLLASEASATPTNPTFSPDGKSIAFMVASEMKRMPSTGGTPTTICGKCGGYGLQWSSEYLYFGTLGSGIRRVRASGGVPEQVIPAAESDVFSEPQVLPGGEAILFTSGKSSARRGSWATPKVEVFVVKSGVRRVLVENAMHGQYLPTGHLVYWTDGVLVAAAFNPRKLELIGTSVPVVEGVARGSGAAHFTYSQTGTLAYLPGHVGPTGQLVLARVDRKGAVEPLNVPPGDYGFPRLSKDGKRVVYEVEEPTEAGIWIWDLAGGSSPRRFTLPGKGVNRAPIWSPDGQFVTYQSDREGDVGIWRQRSDGTGIPEHLTTPPKGVSHIPDAWSNDGRTLLFTQEVEGKPSEIWAYSLATHKAELFASAPDTWLARVAFSPDGRWIAYQSLSKERASKGIYVRRFPRTEDVYIAPPDRDGHHPVWSPDGKELFYIAGPNQLHHRTVTVGKDISFGPAQAGTSGFNTMIGSAVRTFDVLPDGEHMIGVVPAGTKVSSRGETQLRIVVNWFEELNQKAPLM